MPTTIPITHPDFFHAALVCRAKKDVRTYLQALHIYPERGQVVATDGSRLFSTICLEPQDPDDFPPPFPPFLLEPRTKVPARMKLEHIELDEPTDGDLPERGFLVAESGQRTECQITPQERPGFHEFLLKMVKENPPSEHCAFGFDPLLVADIATALRATGALIGFADKDRSTLPASQYRILFRGTRETALYDCLLMPLRLTAGSPTEAEILVGLRTPETL